MTTEERQNFDAFQRKLQESPANRLGFFASVEGIESLNRQIIRLTNGNGMQSMRIRRSANILVLNTTKRILQYQTRNWPVTGHRDCQTHNIR